MKRIFVLLITTTMMAATVFADPTTGDPGTPDENPEVGFEYSLYPIINSNKIRLAWEQEADQKVVIKIFDDQDQLVFTDIQKSEKMKANYDLSSVGSGLYKVMITTRDYRTVEEVRVGGETTSPFSAYLSPAPIDHKIRVAFQHAKSDVRLSIANAATGEVVYERNIEGKANFSSVYNVSKLSSGQYKITLASGGKTVQQIYSL